MMDGQLLERYQVECDEEAFRTLVERHGPMVLGTCARMLDDRHDAEDAFQATFLILARRAGSIRCDASIAPWLHRVAVRVALRARACKHGRRALRSPFGESAGWPARGELTEHDRRVLHEEVGRLPEAFRAPLVLCYFEGKSNREAAGQLRCPVGTIKGRLSRARELLRGRLIRRGLAPADRDG